MMEFVHVVVAVFSFLSLGQAAPVTSCENLIQKIEIQGRDQLLGTWTYLGESTDIPGSKALAKMFVDNVWWNLTAADNSNGILSFQNQKVFGICFSLSYNIAVENNTLVMAQPYPSTAFLLSSGCPDCLVVYSNYTIGTSSYRGLQLMSRRAKVSAAELEEFKKQVECLNLPETTILSSEKGFCPDPSVSQEPKTIDFTSGSSILSSENLIKLDTFLKSAKHVKMLTDVLSRISGTFATSAKTTEN